jgi:hypothetical protein
LKREQGAGQRRVFLIAFGTTDGHTATVGSFRVDELSSPGHTVTVATGQPARYRIRRTCADTLNTVPTAFVSVCPAVLQHHNAVDRGLQAIINASLRSTSSPIKDATMSSLGKNPRLVDRFLKSAEPHHTAKEIALRP